MDHKREAETITAILDNFIAHRFKLAELGRGSMRTASVQARRTRPLKEGLGAIRSNRLTRSALELYGARRQAGGVSAATVNQEMALLQTALRWAEGDGIEVSVTSTPRVRVEAKHAEPPNLSMAMDTINRLPEHHRDAMMFMALTGLSPHELERIEPCDFRENKLAIGDRPSFPVKVAARRRTIPLSKEAREIARRACEGKGDHTPVFPKRGALAKALEYVRPRTGTPITPKSMRTLFASVVAGKTPEHVLQALMGHAPGSPVTRRHYTRAFPEEMRAATKAMADTLESGRI